MAKEFTLPNLGEGAGAGVVVKVLIRDGERVSDAQPVLEIETDKAIAEVPSTVSGVVRSIGVKEGDEVKAGQVIFTFESEDASDDSGLGEPDRESEGDAQSAAEPDEKGESPEEESENETDPDEADAPDEEPRGDVGERRTEPASQPGRADVPAAPSTRAFAREIGVDIGTVKGTGPGGRISIEDVKAHAKAENERPRGAASVEAALPDFTRWGDVERKAMSGVRRKTAEHLSAAWASVPHVTQFDRADITDLERLRKAYGPRVERAGGKLTPTAILLKVVAGALKVYPQFNASVDMARSEIVYKKYCHIGVAVDTEHGLMVPVVRDVDKKNLVELSVELTEIAERTRDRKLSLEEMQGGCFTISNLGGIGGSGFTPIVNAPEVAILGVARAETSPVYRNNEFVPRMMMPLSLSYDHRVIDGADGARFLRWVAEALENPFLLALEGS